MTKKLSPKIFGRKSFDKKLLDEKCGRNQKLLFEEGIWEKRKLDIFQRLILFDTLTTLAETFDTLHHSKFPKSQTVNAKKF